MHGTLVAHVFVHNFAIPEQGQLELYVQNTRAAWTNEETHIRLSVAELSHGLHVFTARLRGRDGEWLPLSDRRVVFVGATDPAHPWLLTHDIQVVGDGLSSARVGEPALFRIHITRSSGADESQDDDVDTDRLEGEAGDGCRRRGGGAEEGDGATAHAAHASSQELPAPVAEPPWLLQDDEHWTVELRGPAIIRGRVVQNRAVPGVYDASYMVYDPGEYRLSIVLHYVSRHGLRDPGVGGQEDVVEHLVDGSPFLVRASASNVGVCPDPAAIAAAGSSSRRETNHPDGDAGNMSLSEGTGSRQAGAPASFLPFDPRAPRRLCSGMQVHKLASWVACLGQAVPPCHISPVSLSSWQSWRTAGCSCRAGRQAGRGRARGSA